MSAPLRPAEARTSTGQTDSSSGIVVSPHHLASQAGIDVLHEGGNAVDAAIAVNAVLGVVLPDTCGVGGDLFALVHHPGITTPTALNASGRAGSGATADTIRDAGFGEIPRRSHWSITIPGCVDGWEALIERHGSMPLERVLLPAITLAQEGFPISLELGRSLRNIQDLIAGQSSAQPLYPDGEAAPQGAIVKRPRLADTLKAVADGGRQAFYATTAPGIVAASHGAITADDLADIQAEWVEPLGKDLFGSTAWTMPPSSQGYLTLATLRVFEMLEPPSDPNDPMYQHLLIEAYRSVAWERQDFAVDPAHAMVTCRDLIDDERLEQRATSIDPMKAGRWPVPRRSPGGTAYMAARDGRGMGVSLIQSNFGGIGSGRSIAGTGVFLHNRGAGFNLLPGHPNEYGPGKRPLHTLSPTLWTKGSRLSLLLGTRGGDQQPQFLAQFAASFLLAGNCTDDTQDLPRWRSDQPLPGTDSTISVESRFAPATLSVLEERGHVITGAGTHEPDWGPISAVDVGREMKGSADPRVSTSSALLAQNQLLGR